MFLKVPTSRPSRPAQLGSYLVFTGSGSSKGLMVPLRMCLKGRTRIQLGFPFFFTAFISEANFSDKLEQS